MEAEQFGEDSFNDLQGILNHECKKYDALLFDLYNKLKNENNNENNKNNINESRVDESLIDDSNIINTNRTMTTEEKIINNNNNNNLERTLSARRRAKRIRRTRNKIIRDTITSMVLCNNATPIISEDDESNITYQASSRMKLP